MWSHDNSNNGGNYEANHSDSPTFSYLNNDSGANEWDPTAADRGREHGPVQPSFDRYNANNTPGVGENIGGLDVFGNAVQPLQMTIDSTRESSLSGSHTSSQFGLHDNFYQDHPSGLTAGADEHAFRSNSVASNSSMSNNNNRYLYERMSQNNSPALEVLSQNTSARIQSFDHGMSGIGIGIHQGGELRTGNTSSQHNSRHARRLYVGGIPQNQTSEEMLQHFLNDVCSKCLEEENDSSYVISVYMNHKKCFAFVELKTIELTSVCLDLDGIVYCSNILKIQRANEYKPELMVSMPRIPIHFNIKKAPFPNKAMSNSMMMDKKPPMHGMHDDHAHSHNPHEFNPHTTPSSRSSSSEGMEKKSFNFSSTFSSSIIRSCAIADIPRGALVLLGFPYDEGARRAGHITGAALGPRAVRQYLYQLLDGGEGGSMCNPEFGMDWSQQSCGMVICDVGDVPLGLLLEEALAKLGDNIADIIRRGGVPVVIGGSGDMSYANAAGLMTVAGGSIGILSVNSHLNVATPRNETKIQANTASRLLLSDTRFCPPREGLMSEPWCDGKFVHVAAQGTLCTPEEVRFVEDRGGKILWLSKDIRQVNPFSLPSRGSLMADESAEEGQIVKHGSSRPTTPALGSSGISVSSSSSSPFCPCCHSADRLQTLLLPVLSHLKGTSRKRPIYMSLHLESLHDTVLSGVSSRSYDGLSAQEATQVCLLAGADDNVAIFDICGLNPEVGEDMKSPILVAQLTYAFIIGFLRRSVKCEDVGGSKSTPPPLPRGESDRS